MQCEFITTLDWVQIALNDKDKRQHWQQWQEVLSPCSDLLQKFSLLPTLSAVAHLPPLSFALHIPFQLQKPYLSKDDCAFHLLDNPVRKDKVFQAPMVASTSWKGALRAALWQLGHKADHPVTIRLLGNPRESEEQQAGRLYFFPTFFDQIGLEVINPHDRNTGVGARGPILMECVPSGTKGAFLVLYVPFGTFGQGEAERRAEIAEDLQVLCMGVQSMLTTYGFGAKTSSGFGTAELVGEGRLTIRAALDGGLASSAPIAPPQPELPRYLETPTRLHTDLRRADGTLKSEVEYQDLIESRGQKFSKKDKQLYDKAKRWWEDKGQALTQAPEPEPESAPLEPPPVSVYTFHSWEELHQAVQRVAELLKGGTA
ncbi:RAMP superfamily CRISPR-associated protein [Chloroflexus sp.]|uniref:RAMP superfamily CRISPR-associated protein n=1 Tax=Chloroflexus sp. TaxID=1904827 RepID=UPI002ACE58F8|nr:RAMP superfamily CRISPR-associated protein [Chloroflexus sp.]